MQAALRAQTFENSLSVLQQISEIAEKIRPDLGVLQKKTPTGFGQRIWPLLEWPGNSMTVMELAIDF